MSRQWNCSSALLRKYYGKFNWMNVIIQRIRFYEREKRRTWGKELVLDRNKFCVYLRVWFCYQFQTLWNECFSRFFIYVSDIVPWSKNNYLLRQGRYTYCSILFLYNIFKSGSKKLGKESLRNCRERFRMKCLILEGKRKTPISGGKFTGYTHTSTSKHVHLRLPVMKVTGNDVTCRGNYIPVDTTNRRNHRVTLHLLNKGRTKKKARIIC